MPMLPHSSSIFLIPSSVSDYLPSETITALPPFSDKRLCLINLNVKSNPFLQSGGLNSSSRWFIMDVASHSFYTPSDRLMYPFCYNPCLPEQHIWDSNWGPNFVCRTESKFVDTVNKMFNRSRWDQVLKNAIELSTRTDFLKFSEACRIVASCSSHAHYIYIYIVIYTLQFVGLLFSLTLCPYIYFCRPIHDVKILRTSVKDWWLDAIDT